MTTTALIVRPAGVPVAGEIEGEADSGRLLLHDFYRRLYAPLKLRGRSANTKRLYEVMFRNHLKFFGRELWLDELHDDLVSRYMGWHLDRGRAPATANKECNMICALWNFACKRGLLAIYPCVELEPVAEKIPRAWSLQELARLFAAIRAMRGTVGPFPAADWWHALHLLLWDSGERINAILSIRWDWISLDDPVHLSIPAEVRKGRRAARCYPLHADTVEALRRIALPSRKLVLPWPYSPTLIYHHYQKLQRKAGLPQGREFRFHCLRKSVASHGKKAGLDPQELMGHKDARVTHRYLDPRICGQKSIAETLFRPDQSNHN